MSVLSLPSWKPLPRRTRLRVLSGCHRLIRTGLSLVVDPESDQDAADIREASAMGQVGGHDTIIRLLTLSLMRSKSSDLSFLQRKMIHSR